MSRVETRLADLGFSLGAPAAPLAAYVPAVRTGNLVFTAGQLPLADGELIATGPVSGSGRPDGADEARARTAAQQCALNALAAVKSVIGDLDRVTRVVSVTGYVSCAPGFTAHPQVINGASELLVAIFGEAGRHARAAVGVSSLPLNAAVELSVVVQVAPDGGTA